MSEDSYTKQEVLDLSNSFPERGLLCHKCKTIIPQFRDLSDTDKTRILNFIRDGRKMMAMQELRAATGCSNAWAKIWVLHKGKPNPQEDESALCPYCGKPLRTSLAKQCRYCLKDWH